MALPLIPLVLVVGSGFAGYGVYKGATESTRALIITAGLIGAGYLIYKRGR